MNIKILKKINQRVKLEIIDDKYIISYRKLPSEKWEEVSVFSSMKLALRRKHNLTHLIIRDIGLFMYFKNRRLKRNKK
jgi:hypothetical protein